MQQALEKTLPLNTKTCIWGCKSNVFTSELNLNEDVSSCKAV